MCVAQRERSGTSAVRARRERSRAAQPDAARPLRSPTRRDSTPRAARGRRRCRRSRLPKKQPKAQGSKKKKVFRDGAAGGFDPAPLNRRCPPETTLPPREAGASRSGELPYKQRSEREEERKEHTVSKVEAPCRRSISPV